MGLKDNFHIFRGRKSSRWIGSMACMNGGWCGNQIKFRIKCVLPLLLKNAINHCQIGSLRHVCYCHVDWFFNTRSVRVWTCVIMLYNTFNYILVNPIDKVSFQLFHSNQGRRENNYRYPNRNPNFSPCDKTLITSIFYKNFLYATYFDL